MKDGEQVFAILFVNRTGTAETFGYYMDPRIPLSPFIGNQLECDLRIVDLQRTLDMGGRKEWRLQKFAHAGPAPFAVKRMKKT